MIGYNKLISKFGCSYCADVGELLPYSTSEIQFRLINKKLWCTYNNGQENIEFQISKCPICGRRLNSEI